MRSITYKSFGILFFAIVSNTVKAQSKWSKLEIGAGLSGFVYQGDLTPRRLGSLETTKPGLLLFANYKIKPRVILQGSFAWGSLKGNDALYNTPEWRKYRALNFKTGVKEIGAKIIYNTGDDDAEQAYNIRPYVGVGINVNFFKVTRDYSSFNTKFFETQPSVIQGLNQDIATTPRKMQISIPLVLGARRSVSERIDLFGELNYRILFNDYVDGFSYAGNAKVKDRFYTISIGAIYKFRKNNSIKCPSY